MVIEERPDLVQPHALQILGRAEHLVRIGVVGRKQVAQDETFAPSLRPRPAQVSHAIRRGTEMVLVGPSAAVCHSAR